MRCDSEEDVTSFKSTQILSTTITWVQTSFYFRLPSQ